ncbi:MAG: hypothetical protein DRO99_01070 [Candidatus Aenigmatarchaeota archaeon]|nr:MAG: hypothetical protein DRO99_01070 [Candidatus Aenigmarchaeota archaeon]
MEFFALVGVALVIVIVAYFAYTSSIYPTNVPQSTEQQQKLVKDNVVNVAREAADTAVEWLEKKGGYITIPDTEEAVLFTKVSVPIWQKCGSASMVPSLNSITSRLQDYMKTYITAGLSGKTEYFSKNTTLDTASMSVNANILKNKIDFEVYLPTKVNGFPIEQPYTFSVPTKFGEIYEFMSNYAQEAANKRYLELFIINSMYFSKIAADGHGELPTTGYLSKCGEVVTRTPDQLSDALEGIVKYTLGNTEWWTDTTTDPTQPKIYGIKDLGGKTYEQLHPLFHVTDDFNIPMTNSVHLTNPSPLFSSRILTSGGLCISTYSMRYSFKFPVVLRVFDELTGHYFNIGTLVDVEDMMPGDCDDHDPYSACVNNPSSTGGTTDCTGDEGDLPGLMGCPDSSCSASVRVLRPNGYPAKDANVVFGSCIMGKTDSTGRLTGNIGCEKADLSIYYSDDYMYKRCNITSAQIDGDYTVYVYPRLTARIYEVNTANCTKELTTHYASMKFYSPESNCYSYWNNVDQTATDTDCDTMSETECYQSMLSATLTGTVSREMQPNSYTIEAVLLNVTNATDFALFTNTTIGALNGTVTLGTSNKIIEINIPIVDETDTISKNESERLVDDMINVCGIDPIEG